MNLLDRLLLEYRVGHRMLTLPDLVGLYRERRPVRVKRVTIPTTYLKEKGVDYVPPRNGKRPTR